MYQYKTLTILLLFPFLLHAQGKNDYVWMMGRGTSNNPEIHSGGTMIDFNSGQAVPSFFPLPYQFGFDIPCSISDDNGKLQFYTNGCRIINFEHEQVANGDGLSPTELSECNVYPYGFDGYQDMLILPKPGHPGKYVYLHHTYDRWYEQSAVLYSEIDMNANGGKGKVIVKNRLIKDFVEIEGAYAAVRHGNGRDWWIFIPEAKACIYRSWLLTPDTLVGPFLQNWENDLAAQDPGKTCWNGLFSPDGRLFAHVTLSNGYNRIFLYAFDRCSGRL